MQIINLLRGDCVRCSAAKGLPRAAYSAKMGIFLTVFRAFRAFFTLFPSILKFRI